MPNGLWSSRISGLPSGVGVRADEHARGRERDPLSSRDGLSVASVAEGLSAANHVVSSSPRPLAGEWP
jgi:hypothetical protein